MPMKRDRANSLLGLILMLQCAGAALGDDFYAFYTRVVMFIENGRLRFDVGWVGATGADTPVADSALHHVAVIVASAGSGENVRC
jgi:hypothetical protein